MANAPPDVAAAAQAVYRLCQVEVAAGVHSSRASTDRTNWRQWCAFCRDLRLDPSLDGVQDPIPLLQMFAHQVRIGQLAADGRPVRKRTVEQYLRSMELLESFEWNSLKPRKYWTA